MKCYNLYAICVGGGIMLDIILDTLIDAIKLFPFLFITFLIMELFEHKVEHKNKNIIEKAGKLGPFFGSVLGAFPQCGFSAAATNLYATRIISLGTLISIYLSTSDEMLPILLSEQVEFSFILKILLLKIIIGMICGFIIDFIIRKKEKMEIEEFCHDKHCHCEHSIFKSSIKHTLSIFVFILVIEFFLNLGFSYLGEEQVSKLFLKNSVFSPIISSLIGLIPNCGASVVITELYLNNMISYGSMISGLLTGSGVGLLILFRVNRDKKDSLKVALLIYLIGAISGILLQLISNIF